jgi:hypothetical protein
MYTSRLNDGDHSPGAKINIEDKKIEKREGKSSSPHPRRVG